MIIYNNTDCIEYLKDLPDNYFDMALTDPPYLQDYHTGHRKDKSHKFCTAISGDSNEQLIKDYIEQSYRTLKNDSALYLFCSQSKIDFFKQEVEKYFTIKNIIVWVKNNWTAGDLYAAYAKQYEFIIYANKGRCLLNGKRITDVWEFPRVVGSKQLHQNQKPVELLRQCIRYSCHNPNGIVFDGFSGVASTAIACIEEQVNFVGCEIDTEYFRLGKERLDGYKFKE